MDRGGDGLAAGLPSFAIPVIPLTWATLTFVLPYAVILAAIGLIESLLTPNLVGEMTGTRGGASQARLPADSGRPWREPRCQRHRVVRSHLGAALLCRCRRSSHARCGAARARGRLA